MARSATTMWAFTTPAGYRDGFTAPQCITPITATLSRIGTPTSRPLPVSGIACLARFTFPKKTNTPPGGWGQRTKTATGLCGKTCPARSETGARCCDSETNSLRSPHEQIFCCTHDADHHRDGGGGFRFGRAIGHRRSWRVQVGHKRSLHS